MLINTVALDYLRVGSWDTMLSYWWIAYVTQIAERERAEVKRSRLMQYRGMGTGWVFAGVAEQGPQ